jgi:hypothetical protein
MNWHQEFCGSNYNELLQIKQNHVLDSVLYMRIAVESEMWSEDGNERRV